MAFDPEKHVRQLVNQIHAFKRFLIMFYEKPIAADVFKDQYLEVEAGFGLLNDFGIGIQHPNPYRDPPALQAAFAMYLRTSLLTLRPQLSYETFLDSLYSETTDTLIVALKKCAALDSPHAPILMLLGLRQKFPGSTSTNPLAGLHPKIVARCGPLVVGTHFDEAIMNAMKVIEEEVRGKVGGNDFGASLMAFAMKASPPNLPKMEFSAHSGEQEGAFLMFKGVFSAVRNAHGHRFVGEDDPQKTFEILAHASLLMRMLDGATINPSKAITPP